MKMAMKKRVVMACAVAVVLFLALSALRWFFFPAQGANVAESETGETQATGEAGRDAGERSEAAGNLGDMSSLDAGQKDLMTLLITTTWIDAKGDTLLFTTSTMSRKASGESDRDAQEFSLGAVEEIGDMAQGSERSITDYVACVRIGKDWTLLDVSFGSNPVPVASAATGQLIASVGDRSEVTLSIVALGPTVYRPHEKAAVEILGTEALSQAVVGPLDALTEKIQSYCSIVFPTATTATWTGVERVIHTKDQEILYFKLNDAAASMISVLHVPSSGAFEVQSGEKTEFPEDYTTPEVG